MSAPLQFRQVELIAPTHRGEYRVHVMSGDDEYVGLAWATFHDYAGGCSRVEADGLSGLDALGLVQAACQAHADREPAHPPLLGWPASGELEVRR